MNRVARHRWLGLFLLLLPATAPTPAAAQSCIGDCDSSGSVTVDELLVGLNIALGEDPVAECTAFEDRTDGAVTVDELLGGVQNALRGCPSSRVVKASSSVALSSIYVMGFGSLGGFVGGGQGFSSRGRPALLPPIGTAAGFGCDVLFCPGGGQEVQCCDTSSGFFARTFEWSDCQFDATVLNGSYRIELNDANVCEFAPNAVLPPPPGFHFRIVFDDYSEASGDFFGNFVVFAADYEEEFVPLGADCDLIFPEQPILDPLGFAIRGAGVRSVRGTVRTVAGNGPQIFQDLGTTFGVNESSVDIVVLIDDFSEKSCSVGAGINGVFSSTNLLTGREFTETYEDFVVVEAFDAGSILVGLEGTSTTDCLGRVGVSSTEFLRIFPGDVCPVEGVLEISSESPSATATVAYTSFGGVDFDFDGDGFVDESRSSCVDLSVSECGVQQAQNVCAACSGPSDCGAGLVCAPCLFCEETIDETRCAPQDDFALCGDGIFGELFF